MTVILMIYIVIHLWHQYENLSLSAHMYLYHNLIDTTIHSENTILSYVIWLSRMKKEFFPVEM